jgi:hypothetical protein
MRLSRERRPGTSSGLARLSALVLSVLLATPARGMAWAQQSNEAWPEVQYHHWFDDRTRAIVMTAVSRDLSSESSYQAEEGLTVEHRFTSYFLGRIGYRHGGATDGGPYNENRMLLEQTFRLYLPSKVIAEFRTREDFRWLDAGFSMRLRERIQFQRDFTVGGYTFTPYGSAEVYFDTRYDQFSRYRLTAGITLPIVSPHFSIEPYVVRQVDYAGNFNITNAIGLILIAAF